MDEIPSSLYDYPADQSVRPDAPETTKAAAKATERANRTKRRNAHEWLLWAKRRGLTIEELARYMGFGAEVRLASSFPSQLEKLGLAYRTGATRVGSTGHKHLIWWGLEPGEERPENALPIGGRHSYKAMYEQQKAFYENALRYINKHGLGDDFDPAITY